MVRSDIPTYLALSFCLEDLVARGGGWAGGRRGRGGAAPAGGWARAGRLDGADGGAAVPGPAGRPPALHLAPLASQADLHASRLGSYQNSWSERTFFYSAPPPPNFGTKNSDLTEIFALVSEKTL